MKSRSETATLWSRVRRQLGVPTELEKAMPEKRMPSFDVDRVDVGPNRAERALRAMACLFLVTSVIWLVLDPAASVLAQGSGGSPRTLLDSLRGGGFIGIIIIACSVVGFSLAITFAFQMRRDTLIPPEVLEQLEGLFEDEEFDQAFQVCETDDSLLSQILASGLARADDGYEEMQKAMQETGEIETTKLHQKVGYLSVIASVAPLLGLFGTVYGMIVTFNKIAGAEVQPKPADLAGGISIALVTTFLGLLVAIPMTVLYVFFRNRVVNVVLELGGISEDLIGRFKRA